MTQARFQKREREKARQERAAEKRQRRERLASASAEAEQDAPRPPEDAVLAELAALHARFAAEEIDFDDFEAAKDELLRGIHVD